MVFRITLYNVYFDTKADITEIHNNADARNTTTSAVNCPINLVVNKNGKCGALNQKARLKDFYPVMALLTSCSGLDSIC